MSRKGSEAAGVAGRGDGRLPLRGIAVSVGAAALVYLVMVVLADATAVIDAVLTIPGWFWPLLVMLSLLSYSARFVRWQMFLGVLGHPVPAVASALVYLAGFALTTTPGKAGETVRSLYLRRWGVGYAQSIAAFVAERLLDVVAVSVLACLVVLLFPAYQMWAAVAMAVIAMLLIVARARLSGVLLKRLPLGRLSDELGVCQGAVRRFLSGSLGVRAFVLSVVAWGCQGVSLVAIVTVLGGEVDWPVVVGVYCLSILAGAASLIPGGLGATEAAMALLLIGLGMDSATAATAAILSRVATLWLAVSLGIAAMFSLAAKR